MNLAIVLFLSLVLGLSSAVNSQNCEAGGGSCVSKAIPNESCIGLPLECRAGLKCCRNIRDITNKRAPSRPLRQSQNPEKDNLSRKAKKNKRPKKKPAGSKKQMCSITPAKCSKQDGVCVPAQGNSCLSTTVDSLCGKGCTCCTGGSENCKCGQANEVRIVGGQEVSPMHKYPWMVSLVANNYFFCGGAIINDRYIVTAAHCVHGEKAKKIKVALADHNENSNKDDIPGVTQIVAVSKLIVHEKYLDSEYDFDIGLVKLQEPLHLSAYKEIRSVCLPASSSNTYEGYDSIATGWGLQSFSNGNSAPSNLMEVTVPVLSPDCPGNLPKKLNVTENMLCAGYKAGGKDACVGDSGGPLVVMEGSAYVIVGIVSFGFGCARPDVPGIYTRVTQFLDWIATNTQGAVYCT